jgi:hypothetical protein
MTKYLGNHVAVPCLADRKTRVGPVTTLNGTHKDLYNPPAVILIERKYTAEQRVQTIPGRLPRRDSRILVAGWVSAPMQPLESRIFDGTAGNIHFA